MARSATGTQTLTVRDRQPPPPSASSPSRPRETVVLRLSRPKKKKKVTWKEGTVDNEFLGRRSSKKCCIFHKQKPFDEDGSDDEGGRGSGSGGGDGVGEGGGDRATGCCSSHGGGGH